MIMELVDHHEISKDITEPLHDKQLSDEKHPTPQKASDSVSAFTGFSEAAAIEHSLLSTPLITVLPDALLKENSDRKKFTFTFLEEAKFPGFYDKDTQSCLFKWGMQEHCYIKRFTFDQYLESYNIDMFLHDFFNCNPHIKVLGSMDRWGTLGTVTSVAKEATSHSITSLDFFDRLEEHGVVRSNGQIAKCLDEYHDSFLVADDLRKCLLMPEFKQYDIFTESDRQEFIFHVFKAVCLGGRLCQYEDDTKPYLDVTRKIYKDLITVVKNQTTSKLMVASSIYKIVNVASSVSPLFPIDHPQNFCYVSIDHARRHVNLLYHASDTYY
ncbi:hypothetical protein BASA83_000057 [Batrachochytrium salamandrivorans]|nr:hypothetical protein BASA81_014670 [Batrachochytrium salamandrivorans]KAH9277195.1 hypothetical protein BASA83_000057 [Batrachochytrium salamandrivorans]